AVPLCRHCSVSLGKLRVAELVIFGLPTLFFLMLQHRLTLQDVVRGFMPPPMSFWPLLILTYGMFIPNTWRRAALVVGPMALAPPLPGVRRGADGGRRPAAAPAVARRGARLRVGHAPDHPPPARGV